MATLDPQSRLDERLEALLDAHPVRPIVEYVGRRLGLHEGQASLDVQFDCGRVRRAFLKRGPVGAIELEELATRPAPPLRNEAATTPPS